MDTLILPEIRKSSEIPFHSDVAPGDRYVFMARDLFAPTQFYVVGRKVSEIRPDQPEWLDKHRHNCPTFYVLIGDAPDLTGLEAMVEIEGLRVLARSPAAVLLPAYAFHSHKLIRGSGWSFHLNPRPDYLASLASNDFPARSFAGLQEAAVVRRTSVERNEKTERHLKRWRLIDSEIFNDPWMEVHLEQWTRGESQPDFPAQPAVDTDKMWVVFAQREESINLFVSSDEGISSMSSASSWYQRQGTSFSYRYRSGSGFVMSLRKLR